MKHLPYRVTATLRGSTDADGFPIPEGVRAELELSLMEQYSRALDEGRMTLEVTVETFPGPRA